MKDINFPFDEIKESKTVSSKADFDLYHEEDDVALPVVRVKRFTLPNKGERWKVMLDNKVNFVIEGDKISKKEKEFLRSVEGVKFLLNYAKGGIKSLNNLRVALKKEINS